MVPPNHPMCNRVFPYKSYKPSILGYHYFWKHPYVCVCRNCIQWETYLLIYLHVYKVGPGKPATSRVITPVMGGITPVTHLFSAIYRGSITPFITIVRAHLVVCMFVFFIWLRLSDWLDHRKMWPTKVTAQNGNQILDQGIVGCTPTNVPLWEIPM